MFLDQFLIWVGGKIRVPSVTIGFPLIIIMNLLDYEGYPYRHMVMTQKERVQTTRSELMVLFTHICR